MIYMVSIYDQHKKTAFCFRRNDVDHKLKPHKRQKQQKHQKKISNNQVSIYDLHTPSILQKEVFLAKTGCNL